MSITLRSYCFLDSLQPQLAALSRLGWASMLYMTLIQFCLCYVCWFAALERLPAAMASSGTLLVPVVGVVSGDSVVVVLVSFFTGREPAKVEAPAH